MSIPPVSRWLGSQRIDLETCASTNDEAARLARAGAQHGTIVIAKSQSAGRGRDGRTWQSPPRMGLYLSAVLRPQLPLLDVPPMTLAIGIGLCDAIRSTGCVAALKWPNDVLVGHAKVAGVLVEAQSQGHRLESVVIGIGVNLGGVLPPEVAAVATTLEAASGGPVDREEFLVRLLAHVERWVERYVAIGLAEIIPAWTERMVPGLAARALVDGAPLVGEVVGLDDDGALLLRDLDGAVHRVRSGDVEVIRPTHVVAPDPGLPHASC